MNHVFERHAVIPPGALRVLLALLRVYDRDGRATVRTVAAEADRQISTTWAHLERLAIDGLVTSEPGTHGTLRPLVRPVTFHQESRRTP